MSIFQMSELRWLGNASAGARGFLSHPEHPGKPSSVPWPRWNLEAATLEAKLLGEREKHQKKGQYSCEIILLIIFRWSAVSSLFDKSYSIECCGL